MISNSFRARVLVAEDEQFTLNLLRKVLVGDNFEVEAVTCVSETITQVGNIDPYAVFIDLKFAMPGLSGADFMNYIENELPWIGKIVLTSHASPALAIPHGIQIVARLTYLVMSELGSFLI